MEKMKIEKFDNYRLAYERIESLSKEHREHEEEIGSADAKKAEFYRGILSGSIGFPLQWVKGDYEKAEESFLKINSSGRSLTEWERKLVENRNSSFARVVMSLANTTRAEHCWPTKVPAREDRTKIKPKVDEILDGITKLHKILFEPPHDSSFSRVQQPVLAEPHMEPDKKPAYLAELLTIIKGGKGQDAQTEQLIKLDRTATATVLVNNGLKLIKESLDVFNHIVGNASETLALVPAVYFYTEQGKYVRSLLYGFIYWLFAQKDENSILNKKLLFSVHREAFEQILIYKKREIVSSIGRKVGSGSEVTVQTARYYEDLLCLLIRHNSNVKSEDFVEDYEETFKQMIVPGSRMPSTKLFNSLSYCSICRGLIDIENNQISQENSVLAHPFCTNKKSYIESIINGQQIIDLPSFVNQLTSPKPQQLSFLEFEEFSKPLTI